LKQENDRWLVMIERHTHATNKLTHTHTHTHHTHTHAHTHTHTHTRRTKTEAGYLGV